MTDLDIPSTSAARLDTDPSVEPRGHPSLWRIASVLIVVASLLIVVLFVLQARDASDLDASEVFRIELQPTRVTVGDVDIPPGAVVAALGVAGHDRPTIDGFGTDLDIPSELPSVIGLFSGAGELHGLAVVPSASETAAVEISVDSTARALLALSPALLEPQLGQTLANIDVIATDSAYSTLVAAIASNPNLGADNGPVENALAQILDRVPARIPPPAQGCDSVLDPAAFAAAGACVEPAGSEVTITNEQDRWALLYADADWSTLCAAIAPVGAVGSTLTIDADRCGAELLMVAPGPLVNLGPDQAAIDARVRTAGALNLLHSFLVPFADLAASSAGASATSQRHILGKTSTVVEAIDGLIDADPAFAAAAEVLRNPSDPMQRHQSAIGAAKTVLASDVAPNLLPQFGGRSSDALALIDLYERVGDRMTSTRLDWRWQDDAADRVEIEGGT